MTLSDHTPHGNKTGLTAFPSCRRMSSLPARKRQAEQHQDPVSPARAGVWRFTEYRRHRLRPPGPAGWLRRYTPETIRAPSTARQCGPAALSCTDSESSKFQAAKCLFHAIDRGLASIAPKRQRETTGVSPSGVSLWPSWDVLENKKVLSGWEGPCRLDFSGKSKRRGM